MTVMTALGIVHIRVFDDNYQVLRRHTIRRALDLDAPETVYTLGHIVAQVTHLGRTLENEPMTDVRLELWTEDGRTRVGTFAHGMLL